MRNKLLAFAAIAALSSTAACDFTTVDSTEHCVETRYGKVVDEKMDNGLNFLGFNDATCFNMTEQNWPAGNGDEVKEVIAATAADKLNIQADVALIWAYDPATVVEVFAEKRSPAAVEAELRNAVREGFRNAAAGWTVDALLSPARAAFGDSVRAHIQAKIGNRARIVNVFIRNISLPQAIQDQQLAKMEAVRRRDTEQANFQADSVKAFNREYQAQVDANIRELTAQVYDQNPSLLRLEIEKTRTEGLRGICGQSTTCIIGGTVADRWMANGSSQ